LLGANFSGSNMAYAEITESDLNYTNLERVRLIGANLKDADLSYADISNALFTGANMSNTKFDNAIWIDGQVCKKNSIGSCLTGRLDQE